MASEIGVDISTYRKYERDEVSPSLEKLEKIANALEVSIISLFPETVVQNNDKQSSGVALEHHSSIQLSEIAIEEM